MADRNQPAKTTISQLTQNSSTSTTQVNESAINGNILSELRKLNAQVSALQNNVQNMSQTNGANAFNSGFNNSNQFRDEYTNSFGTNSQSSGKDYIKTESGKSVNKRETKGFTGALEDTLFDKPFKDGFQKVIQDGMKDSVNGSFKNMDPKSFLGNFGSNISKQAANSLKDSKFGKEVFGPISNVSKVAGESLGSVIKGFGEEGFGGAAKAAGPAIKSLSSAAAAAGPQIALVVGGMIALDMAMDALIPAIEGTTELFKTVDTVANREANSAKENRKKAQERLVADVESMVKTPFRILEDAANRLYQAWDNNIRVINQTQGYSKADLQSLMGGFAERIRSEGLSGSVSAADITDNLAKVLQAGLSGKIAEEFAYQATILNSAIPTQDFFGYADTFASVAGNLVKNGASQDEAIAAATSNLRTFASSLLYANRQLSGGFSTGLKNAQDIYEKSVKIATAARTSNSAQIAGVLASAASATGAVAPDLVSTITDTIYQVATGGNTDQVVALRSLYGAAENTEFLRQFASDPQKVMKTIFTNLATMFNSSSGVYMTAAGPYAELFGMSSEAFQRLDFNYLANAIGSMSVANDSINENIELLKSGQSTLTKEQLRAEQINTYMIEEGLAYVLDSEVGREIQQHMWQEQIARELMEATYGVELKGAALDFLQGIQQTVKNLLDLFNPVAWAKKVFEVSHTVNEEHGLEKDIQQALELTKVGGGNARDLRNLVTRNADLGLTPTLVELLGGTSAYAQASSNRKMMENAMDALAGGPLGLVGLSPRSMLSKASAAGEGGIISPLSGGSATFGGSSGISSAYSWRGVGKSAAAAVNAAISGGSGNNLIPASVNVNGSKAAANAVADKIQKMLADEYLVDKFVKEGKTYQDFAASAKNFGIADFDKALEEAGYNKTEVEGYFQSQETKAGAEVYENIRVDEKDFRDAGRKFWREDFWQIYQEPFFEELDIIEEEYLQKIIDNQIEWKKWFSETWNKNYVEGWLKTRWDKQFWKEFNAYFFEHKIYNGGTLKLTELEKVQKNEKAEKGDLANALSEYLTLNNQNLKDLQDPTIQTNMILSQILVVTNAIMNQVAKSEGSLSLADTLAAAATGLTSANSTGEE